MIFGSLNSSAQYMEWALVLDRAYEKIWNWVNTSQDMYPSCLNFCGTIGFLSHLVIHIDSSLWLLCSPSVNNINTEQPAPFALLTLHKISNKSKNVFWGCMPSFNFFHKPYQVLELIPCIEYLSPDSQKSHFWKLKIKRHNCTGIKYTCSKYHWNILDGFHKILSELQLNSKQCPKMALGGSRAKDNKWGGPDLKSGCGCSKVTVCSWKWLPS